MSIFWYFILAIIFFILIIIFTYFCYKKNKKKKQLRRINNIKELTDYGEKLLQNMEAFWKKRTIINFKIKTLNNNQEKFNKINWENKDYNLDSEIPMFEINNNEIKEKNTIVVQKTILLKGKKTREFLIDVYLHQINNYELFIDYNENSYSIETIFFSFNNNYLPKNIKMKEIDLSLDNFNFSDRLINNVINIDKDNAITFINKYSNLNIQSNNPIFNNENNNLFLNVYIKEKDRLSCLFINEKEKVLYKLNKFDIKFLNDFYNFIMIPFVFPYKKYNPRKITFSNKRIFEEEFLNFIDNNNYNIDEKTKYDISNNINKSSEYLIIKKNDILLVNQKDNQEEIKENKNPFEKIEEEKNEEEKNEEEEESSDISDSIQLEKIKKLLVKFFDLPFHKRFEDDEINLENYEKICYLYLIINTNYDLSKLILYLRIKEKIFKKALNINNKYRLNISFAICNLIIEDYIKDDNIELMEMANLPGESPYFEGEIMYRNIIKAMTERSKIKFIFLQINSGCGFDFIKNEKCYQIKMLPLDSIKYHLLSNNTKYFLRFWNEDIDELACIDSYTNLESINERLLFGEDAWTNKSIAYKHKSDNSIKFCLIK